MLEHNKKVEIVKCLQNAMGNELNRDEMEQLLDAELTKPEAEMDTDLVQMLLELLEEDSPASGVTEAQQKAAWKQTARKLAKPRLSSVMTWVVRSAAVIVLLIAVFFATYQTAEALNWHTLLRWMKPVAEIFTLYSDSIPEDEVVQAQSGDNSSTTIERKEGPYSDSCNESTLRQITDYADAPERLHGYPAKAAGIPARFQFEQGSVYTDERLTTASYVFSGAEGTCIFELRIPGTLEDIPTTHQYEKTIDEPLEILVHQLPVSYYYNADCKTLSASWTMNDVQYTLFGSLTQEEMTDIIEATIFPDAKE